MVGAGRLVTAYRFRVLLVSHVGVVVGDAVFLIAFGRDAAYRFAVTKLGNVGDPFYLGFGGCTFDVPRNCVFDLSESTTLPLAGAWPFMGHAYLTRNANEHLFGSLRAQSFRALSFKRTPWCS